MEFALIATKESPIIVAQFVNNQFKELFVLLKNDNVNFSHQLILFFFINQSYSF